MPDRLFSTGDPMKLFSKYLLLFILLYTSSLTFSQEQRIKLATTTSTENSGLLNYLLPVFTEKTGIKVNVISVGTGKALKLGENGDVDLVLVHARSLEDAFVEKGFGVNRKDVMYNDFVIIGPLSDPAKIGKKAGTAAKAFFYIAKKKSSFISRGDNSGTNVKELSIWKESGITPGGKWYKEAGMGMSEVITMANNLLAYTLIDRGTYLAYKDKIDLVILYEGDEALFNPYGIIAVNPEKHKHVQYEAAMALIEWITSAEGQKLIEDFRKNGEILFRPNAR